MPAKGLWRAFEEARKFARSLDLKSVLGWKEWAKNGTRPKDIPASPRHAYIDQCAHFSGEYRPSPLGGRRRANVGSYESASLTAHLLPSPSRRRVVFCGGFRLPTHVVSPSDPEVWEHPEARLPKRQVT